MGADELLAPGWTSPRARADAALDRARHRHSGVVTPDTMASPMDHAVTVVIPRHVVTAADPRLVDPDSTVVLPVSR